MGHGGHGGQVEAEVSGYEESWCPACDEALQPIVALSFCPHCRFPLLLVAGKYKLEACLAQGGFGAVYLARHTGLTHFAERVIKIIKPELLALPSIRKRFHREVQVTARLAQESPHIVHVYDDFGECPKLGYYYVMEYLKGTTLRERLTSVGGPLPLASIASLFGQLTEAMQVAHNARILHRDLKPANMILLDKEGAPDFLKVLDFGIAKPLGHEQDSLGLTRGPLGTPAYMAPEQCLHRRLDERTDIYALGTILYELLTGVTPFPWDPAEENAGVEAHDLLHAQIHQHPPPLSLRVPGKAYSQALEDVVQCALAKTPQERYPSVSAMWEALEQALASQPADDLNVGAAGALDRGAALAAKGPAPTAAPAPIGPWMYQTMDAPKAASTPPADQSEGVLAANDVNAAIASPKHAQLASKSAAIAPTASGPVVSLKRDEPVQVPMPAFVGLAGIDEPSHASLPGQEPRSPRRFKAAVWLSCVVALGGLVWGVMWWGQRPLVGQPAQPRGSHARSVRAPMPLGKSVGVPIARVSEPPGSLVPKRKRVAPQARSVLRLPRAHAPKQPLARKSPVARKRLVVRKRLVARKRRLRRAWSAPSRKRSQARPKPPQARHQGVGRWVRGCPKTPLYWVHARFDVPGQRALIRPVLPKGGKRIPSGQGICFGVKEAHMRVIFGRSAQGFVPCHLLPAKSAATVRIKLLKEGDGLEPSSKQYCVR